MQYLPHKGAFASGRAFLKHCLLYAVARTIIGSLQAFLIDGPRVQVSEGTHRQRHGGLADPVVTQDESQLEFIEINLIPNDRNVRVPDEIIAGLPDVFARGTLLEKIHSFRGMLFQ